MRSTKNGLYSTLMTVVLILSVPLFAVFGIPQFIPVIASPSPLDESEFAAAVRGSMPDESPRSAAAELIAPLPVSQESPARTAPFENSDELTHWDDPFESSRIPSQSPPSALDDWTFVAKDNSVNRLPADAETLTWRTAVQQLDQYGIRQFRLQPGEREYEFHFVCYFTPVNNPRITHRFDAEATEPLIAVQKVLDQIAEWTRTR